MTDEEKIICDDCKNGEHCDNQCDDECNCSCTYKNEDNDEGEDDSESSSIEQIDEVDDDYSPDNVEDLADDHLSHNGSKFGNMMIKFILLSVVIISVVYVYDSGYLGVIDFPFINITQPDNPIVVEKNEISQSGVVTDFIPTCNLIITRDYSNNVVNGRLQCISEPTQQQIAEAESKFQSVYGGN